MTSARWLTPISARAVNSNGSTTTSPHTNRNPFSKELTMKGSDVFPSKYLRAADLNGKEPIVTIDHIAVETLGDDSKPVVYFVGKSKGLVLNKTNWNAIEEIAGQDDSDQWKGVRVKLFMAKVEFQGKRVPAIRVDAPMSTRPAPPPEPVDALNDSDIPF